MSGLPILVVEHQATCPPGWLGEGLTAARCRLEVARPYAGATLPADLAAYAGLVVLGGRMGAHDDATTPWLRRTKDLLREAAASARPTLGVCLGHQLAAVAMGGAVEPNPRGKTRGVVAVGWTPAAGEDPLFADLAGGGEARAVQWNADVVTELPPPAVLLARSAGGQVQAARFAPTVWGVQWHPEAGATVVAEWAAVDRAADPAAGEAIERALAQVTAAQEHLRATWVGLATRFAGLCLG